MVDKLNVGIIGVGYISPQYIKSCRMFNAVNVVACADMNMERAQQVAAEYDLKAYSVDDLLADSSIDLVMNLTVPMAHVEINHKIIAAGKHLYTEKPIAISLDDAGKILDAARTKGVRVGSAPDTFLYSKHQTVRKLFDEGVIGKPVSGVGFFASRGTENWHPNADFYYQPGGGPMLDMGPYWINCLINLLGAVKRVNGTTKRTFPERIHKDGHHIPVQVETHYTGVIEFVSGVVVTMLMSFDVKAHSLPLMEIYGETGTLSVPDPNGHRMVDIKVFDGEWRVEPDVYQKEWMRGVGVADMVYGIVYDRPHRASGELAYHTLEVMNAFEESGRTGKHIDIQSTIERPAPIPMGLPERELDK
jgi:predicted dehydrogenase